jgi:hypothetical protein
VWNALIRSGKQLMTVVVGWEQIISRLQTVGESIDSFGKVGMFGSPATATPIAIAVSMGIDHF